MAFKKAQPAQAYFKAGMYGKQGSGKTLTSLLFAEHLAKREKKRVAFIDTERGTDFYTTAIPERKIHPEAFDIDAIYGRSIMQAVDELESLDANEYGVVVIDSITHLWEAAKEAYTGPVLSNGSFPIQAWGKIKKPYKKLMQLFLDGQFHAILCGREGVVMENDEDGQAQVVGTKMKAEGDTSYEPNFLFRFKPEWQEDGTQRIAMYTEKDRSGILQGKVIYEPTPAHIDPILRYLYADNQGVVGSVEDAAAKDAEMIAKQDEKVREERRNIFDQIKRAIGSATSVAELKTAWSLTNGKKTKLGDDLFGQLEVLKDAKKVEVVGAV